MMGHGILSSYQIKAGRALLDWSQKDLAEATGLAVTTIRMLEMGNISPRSATTSTVRRIMESHAIEFLDSDGVRRRDEEMIIFQGAESVSAFIEDIQETLKKSGGDVLIVSSTDMLEDDISDWEAFFETEYDSTVKCLSVEAPLPVCSSSVEARYVAKQYIDPVPFCVYGKKYALIVFGAAFPKIIVVSSMAAAQKGTKHFCSIWEKATPISSRTNIGARKILKRIGKQ